MKKNEVFVCSNCGYELDTESKRRNRDTIYVGLKPYGESKPVCPNCGKDGFTVKEKK